LKTNKLRKRIKHEKKVIKRMRIILDKKTKLNKSSRDEIKKKSKFKSIKNKTNSNKKIEIQN
jgi:hypothetical protein